MTVKRLYFVLLHVRDATIPFPVENLTNRDVLLVFRYTHAYKLVLNQTFVRPSPKISCQLSPTRRCP